MPFFKMCRRAGCPWDALPGQSHCAEHSRTWRKSTLASLYGSRRWRKVRRRVLIRDEYTCTRCGRNEVELRPNEKLLVDHIGGWDGYSDPYDLRRLRTLCSRCSGEVDGPRSGSVDLPIGVGP